ncbi:DNA primase [Desulfopila aestuarii]|uniref:DNA primase n=1 Tax=Desulfopila aestuarii DSM 18488 TaxID=1121416 RepID=A0A1M7Y2N6_9BACT|nr:DNA primase [Desulfopila aestuarii]SHO46225.1 DNA primase [Desulfopila aestuarii DSM 18488]
MQESREEIVARVKDRADIVQIIGETVDLKKSGARFLGLCPFHGEKSPSFSVHPGQQFFYCFGCGESGDVFTYFMKYHNLDFPSALKELAGRYGISLPEKSQSPEQERQEKQRKEMFQVSDKAAEIYSRFLADAPQAAVARSYLEKRGIPQEIRKRFGLGYAPAVESSGWDFLSHQLAEGEQAAALEAGLLVRNERGGVYDRFRDRVLFPIQELSGRVCGFGGRIIGEGQPKYLNSPESRIYIKSKLLLGLYQAKDAIRVQNQAIIVEGNFDLVSLVCHGCENVVAPLGTALTREQLRLLKRFADNVVLLFDGDEAGVKAAVRAVPHFLAEQVAGRVALLPIGHDPDTFVREEGIEAVRRLVEGAESLPEFTFKQLVAEFGLTLDGKSRIVEALRPLVKAAASPLQRTVIISHFSEQLGLSPEQLDTMLERPEPVPVEVPQASMVTVKRRPENVEPLTAAQKRLVAFMVLNPRFFTRLAEGGLRDCLVGSVGEILFLQLRRLIDTREEVEPEELLSVLPEGAERTMVSNMLLEATNDGGSENQAELDEEEIVELLQWIRQYGLQRSSERLLKKINAVQSTGNFAELQELLREKQRIDRALQGVENA